MKKKLILITITLCTLFRVHGQTLRGIVKDKNTSDTLAYATVNFQGSTEGTISNAQGYFELYIDENQQKTPIQISYMGYESTLIPQETFGSEVLEIGLKPTILTLEALIVRPLSPQEYIKRVIKNMSNVLPQDPFTGQSYYREKFLENGDYLLFSEGVFKSYYPKYQDTTTNQHQLMLYETAQNPQEVQFMRESFEKKNAKAQRKAEKKGKEFEEKEFGVIEQSFGGPDQILSMDMSKDLDDFLDSTMFQKFNYFFTDPISYQDRELLVIGFKSKGTVDHLKSEGNIYIDLKSEAFAAIEFTAKPIIPVILQPILFAYGLSIQDPLITKKLRYQYMDGVWYPEYFHIHIDLGLKKRHIFGKNEHSSFEIEQLLKITHLMTENPTPIPEDLRFDSSKELQDQIYNDENMSWNEINRLAE